MRVFVWVDAWQLECCGDPFAVGDEVTWLLSEEVDASWLGERLGREVAADVSLTEDHHEVAGGCRLYAGRISIIQQVETLYRGDAADPRVLRPVAGSSVLTLVTAADGEEVAASARQLDGYLVGFDGLHALPQRGGAV